MQPMLQPPNLPNNAKITRNPKPLIHIPTLMPNLNTRFRLDTSRILKGNPMVALSDDVVALLAVDFFFVVEDWETTRV